MQKETEKISRRDFLKTGLRFVVLSGMAGLALKLLGKKSTDNSAAAKCTNQYFCRNCFAVNTCYLPEAQSLRAVLKKG